MSGEDGAGPALDAEVGARCNDECEWLECLVWTADDVDDANEAEGGCRRVRTVGSAWAIAKLRDAKIAPCSFHPVESSVAM